MQIMHKLCTNYASYHDVTFTQKLCINNAYYAQIMHKYALYALITQTLSRNYARYAKITQNYAKLRKNYAQEITQKLRIRV